MAMQWSCISRAPPWGPFLSCRAGWSSPRRPLLWPTGMADGRMRWAGVETCSCRTSRCAFTSGSIRCPQVTGPPTPTYAVGPLPFNTPLPTQRLACAEDAVLYVCCTCTPCSPACLAACDRGWLQLAHTPLYQRHTLPACLLCDLR